MCIYYQECFTNWNCFIILCRLNYIFMYKHSTHYTKVASRKGSKWWTSKHRTSYVVYSCNSSFNPLIRNVNSGLVLEQINFQVYWHPLTHVGEGLGLNKNRCLSPVTRQSLENVPDPSNSSFFLFHKNHPGNTVYTIFNHFFCKLDFPPILPTKSLLTKDF